MQYPTLLPTLALASLAAAASAQTVPVKTSSAPSQLTVGVSWARATDSVAGIGGPPDISTDAHTVDLRAAVSGNAFLTAAYTDASIDDSGAPDVTSYAIGFGGRLAAGNGHLEASYAFRQIDVEGAPFGEYDQHLVELSYSLDLGNGFNVGLGVLQIFNSEAFFDDVTAPFVSIGFGNNRGLGAELSVSNENTVFGLEDGGNTTTLSVRYGF